MTNRRWMAVITEEQYEWLQATQQATGLKGAEIVREAITNAMEDKSFRSSLAQAHLKIQLESLQARKAELEAQTKELQKKIQRSLVTA